MFIVLPQKLRRYEVVSVRALIDAKSSQREEDRVARERKVKSDLLQAAATAIGSGIVPGVIVIHRESRKEYEVLEIRIKTGSLVVKVPGAAPRRFPQVFRADLFELKQTA